MAKKNSNSKKQCYISVPSQIINSLSSSSLQSLLDSPKKSSKTYNKYLSLSTYRSSKKLWLLAIFLFGLLGMLKLTLNLSPLIDYVSYPCFTSQSLSQGLVSNGVLKSGVIDREKENVLQVEILNDSVQSLRLISNGVLKSDEGFGEENEQQEFWKQPNGLGYKPCLDFSQEYRKSTTGIVSERTKYLMVVVSGGMNQQRNQIVDAVVIARILGAALVVPILQVNVIWGDESEFSDIFDLEHFKNVLADDVRIVSSLPSTHLMTRPVEEKSTPHHVSPSWIRSRYLRKVRMVKGILVFVLLAAMASLRSSLLQKWQASWLIGKESLRREGVLLLRGLDSRLSKDLPSDLQKLRCKVAFHALRFAPPIVELGNKLTERMRNKGPYLALHLRMEKDVWVRTGCLPGLSPEYDEMINNERIRRPELLTARSNMSYHDRKLAGLCPLNAYEVMRLLKALGAPRDTRIYWAGGQPLGGKEALQPLTREFPNFYNKEDLALPSELEPFAKKASFMAAIDYIVCESSDIFMPSHGGNMGHAIQGHRAYAGHKKYITPNKRHMLPLFLDSSLPEAEFNRIIKELHEDSLGQPELRTSKVGRDVTKYPIPECMCNNSSAAHTI